MPTVQQQERNLSICSELFQLDQPIGFRFYRIMHAKAEQVTAFLQNDLLNIIEQAFGQAGGDKLAALQKAYENLRRQSLGAVDRSRPTL
jgi:adenine-specific DNA-methyltransferase